MTSGFERKIRLRLCICVRCERRAASFRRDEGRHIDDEVGARLERGFGPPHHVPRSHRQRPEQAGHGVGRAKLREPAGIAGRRHRIGRESADGHVIGMQVRSVRIEGHDDVRAHGTDDLNKLAPDGVRGCEGQPTVRVSEYAHGANPEVPRTPPSTPLGARLPAARVGRPEGRPPCPGRRESRCTGPHGRLPRSSGTRAPPRTRTRRPDGQIRGAGVAAQAGSSRIRASLPRRAPRVRPAEAEPACLAPRPGSRDTLTAAAQSLALRDTPSPAPGRVAAGAAPVPNPESRIPNPESRVPRVHCSR